MLTHRQDSDNPSLRTAEKGQLLQLLDDLVLAIYGPQPVRARSGLAFVVHRDLENVGIRLHVDTVRKWLKLARHRASQLPTLTTLERKTLLRMVLGICAKKIPYAHNQVASNERRLTAIESLVSKRGSAGVVRKFMREAEAEFSDELTSNSSSQTEFGQTACESLQPFRTSAGALSNKRGMK